MAISNNYVTGLSGFAQRTLFMALSVALVFTCSLAAPVTAHADSADGLMAQVKNIRASVDGAKSEYLAAIQRTSELQAQSDELSAQLIDIEGQIADKREKLSQLLVQEYKSPSTQSFLNAISEAGSLDEALKQFEYANLVAQDRASTISEIRQLVKLQHESVEEIEMKKSEALNAAAEAEAAQSGWDEQLAELRPQLKELREKYWSEAANTSGSEQLDAAMAYLEDIDGITETQAALLRSAYRTSYAGSNYCERWAANVYENAGYPYKRYVGAAQDAQANMKSDDLDTIPVGALVFGSGSSSIVGATYGHVGICVVSGTGNNDALILDNEGSRDKHAVPLSEWSEWQTSVSWVSGKQGAFGWGYPPSIDPLTPVTL